MTIGHQSSSRFKDEMRIIAPWVFFLAVLLVPITVVLFGTLMGRDPHAPPLALRCLMGVVGGTVVGCYVLLIGYINRDSGLRRMSRLLWTLVAILVPNGLGIVLYFVLRKPRTVNCPQCNTGVEPGYSFCPHCRNRLQPVCPHCQRSVNAGDKFCPYCGRDLDPAAAVSPVADMSQP